MLVSVSSISGSPGVTSWSLLLGAAWPSEIDVDRVVIEADPDGAVLGSRYDIGVEPGVVSLLGACRDRSVVDVAAHGRRVTNDGLWLVPGPEVAEVAWPSWSSSVETAAEVFATDSRVWIADVGRLSPGSPVRGLSMLSTLNLIVCRPEPESLVQVPARVSALARASRVGVLVCGSTSYELAHLRDYFGVDDVWIAASDPLLPALTARLLTGGRMRRHRVWQSAVVVAADVADVVADASPPARVPGLSEAGS